MTAALEVVPSNVSVLGSQSQLDLLKSTVASGLTDGEFELFAAVCQRTGLDPFVKQIYAVKRWSGREKREVMTIQVGIDGYRLIADRTGKCAGIDDAVFTGTVAGGYPELASVTVYKIVAGQRCPFTASARWVEYVPGEKQDAMWKRMPHVMLGKVAEALALRKAFPAELSGMYTSEEMAQADVTIAPVDMVTVPTPGPFVPDGFANADAAKDAHALVRTKLAELDDPERARLNAWREENGINGWPLSLGQLVALEGKVEELLRSREPNEHAGEDPGDHGSAAGAAVPEPPAAAPVPSLPNLDTFDGAPRSGWADKTLPELREALRARALEVSGTKREMVAALVEYELESEPF